MKPAVKTRPHHRGGRIQPKQPINKTIGINKLGTLLSSQTTDTPGTTQTNVQDRSGATFQTYPTTGSFANQRFRDSSFQQSAPTRTGTPKSEPFPGHLKKGGWPQTFRISGGDSENNTPPHPTPQIHPNTTPTPPKTPKTRGTFRQTAPTFPPITQRPRLWTRSHLPAPHNSRVPQRLPPGLPIIR